MPDAADRGPLRPEQLVRDALEVFEADACAPPPLTLRGGCDLDDYRSPAKFDHELDEPTDAYLERYTFWALGYLDARSWRHYLPRLIEYALAHRADPGMVAEALIRSLRPPDRYPPRLASLSIDQEDLVRRFLETVAFGEAEGGLRDDARQALEEWWWPHPRSRPTSAEVEAARARPVIFREAFGDGYRLMVPETLVSSGERDIPSESRRVQMWAGYVCSDVHTLVAVNRLTGAVAPVEQAKSYARFFATRVEPVPCHVPGAREAVCVDGETTIDGPGNPERVVIIVGKSRDLFALTIRGHDRGDVRAVIRQIAGSFVIDDE